MTIFFVVWHRWLWKTLNFQNKGFYWFLAIFGCSAHAKNELRRNGWRYTDEYEWMNEFARLVSISSNFLFRFRVRTDGETVGTCKMYIAVYWTVDSRTITICCSIIWQFSAFFIAIVWWLPAGSPVIPTCGKSKLRINRSCKNLEGATFLRTRVRKTLRYLCILTHFFEMLLWCIFVLLQLVTFFILIHVHLYKYFVMQWCIVFETV